MSMTSDEFVRVATQEINSDLAEIKKILDLCKNDSDISLNSTKIESHLHKLKGLVPMLGKEQTGQIASILDSLMKCIVDGQNLTNIYDVLVESTNTMIHNIQNKESDSSLILEKIKNTYAEFLPKT